jgi:peptidase E
MWRADYLLRQLDNFGYRGKGLRFGNDSSTRLPPLLLMSNLLASGDNLNKASTMISIYKNIRHIVYIPNAALPLKTNAPKPRRNYDEIVTKVKRLFEVFQCQELLVYHLYCHQSFTRDMQDDSAELEKRMRGLNVSHNVQTSGTIEWPTKPDLIFCDGGETHWLFACAKFSGLKVYMDTNSDVIWSGESAGSILAGPSSCLALKKLELGKWLVDRDDPMYGTMENTTYLQPSFAQQEDIYQDGIGLCEYIAVPHFNNCINPREFWINAKKWLDTKKWKIMSFCDGEVMLSYDGLLTRFPEENTRTYKHWTTYWPQYEISRDLFSKQHGPRKD